jgi:hypothetical protein
VPFFSKEDEQEYSNPALISKKDEQEFSSDKERNNATRLAVRSNDKFSESDTSGNIIRTKNSRAKTQQGAGGVRGTTPAFVRATPRPQQRFPGGTTSRETSAQKSSLLGPSSA